MPSTTFDQLGDVRNVCTEHNITIATTDWSSTAPYTYEWTSTLIAENSDVEVEPRDGAEAAQIEDFDYEKSTGKVTFTVDKIPAAALPLTVKIINAKPGAFQSLNASDVSSEAITGANNVEAALSELNSNITNIVKYYTTSQSITFSTWSAGAIAVVDTSGFPFTVDKIVGFMVSVASISCYAGIGSLGEIIVMTPSSVDNTRTAYFRIAYIP